MRSAPGSGAADRRVRDRRIRELRAEPNNWSLSAIAAEVGLSDERVRQVLAAPADPVADRRAALAAELDELVRHREDNRRRIRIVQRALERIDEEREAQAIDRLLGLA